MSDDLYRVVYLDRDGHEQVTGAMTRDEAERRARAMDASGYTVGSVTTASAAEAYMQDRYSPTYRGVKVPEGLREDWPRSVFDAWKRGVDSALDGGRP